MNTKFEEKQQFRQWWLWLIILATSASVIAMPYLEGNEISSLAYGISIVFIVLLITFFLLLKLKSTVDSSGISFTFFPMSKKHYTWDEIAEAKIVDYGFIGGWGIRMGTKYGTVYNIKGKIGLHVVLKSGKQFVIGTQKHKALNNTLNALAK